MKNRIDTLKRKMDEKRKSRKHSPHKQIVRERDRGMDLPPFSMKHVDEREDTLYSYDYKRPLAESQGGTFFRKDRFIMQILASVCLFFAIGILLQSQSSTLDGVRQYVQNSFHEDFQFTAVADWYEEAFGRPLALLPPNMEMVAPGNLDDGDDFDNVYALPATGTVRQSFQENGRGVYVETNSDQAVEAIRSGYVTFIGEDDEGEWGKVVVVRHPDGGESWYGMLDNISVELYAPIVSGDLLGTVSPHIEMEGVGVYYFALKEDDTFVDPIEVVPFD
ncbi:peptidoglycan DD-metalloendopeptidase family protein [Evansella sp. AB-rgal1]|uniref:peptidoglycan DD-metalloendopeptidase family protein n=1 Tax=Evansella sp. AB-rgal1 TaxID=3242696 RepID=UPI00359CBAE6